MTGRPRAWLPPGPLLSSPLYRPTSTTVPISSSPTPRPTSVWPPPLSLFQKTRLAEAIGFRQAIHLEVFCLHLLSSSMLVDQGGHWFLPETPRFCDSTLSVFLLSYGNSSSFFISPQP